MVRLGVLTNPNSGRNRRMPGRVPGLLGMVPEVAHAVTASYDGVPAALAELAARDVDVVAVNGGDGSVAHVLTTVLGADSPFPAPPLLCALPGGTTNVTVGDVGIRGALDTALLKLLAWRRGHAPAARIVERPVIGVRNAGGTLLGCGLVFGTGAVVDGIEYWQQSVRARGMRSEFSSGVAMVRTIWGMLNGHRGFADAPHTRVDAKGLEPIDGELMLLVVSTLERLFLGIHPFWGPGEGTLHFTAIERGARGFLRALPSIVRGRERALTCPDNGYHSARLAALRLDFRGGFTLDGELHALAPGDSPLLIGCAGTARFLRI
jgi:hypothetical protein